MLSKENIESQGFILYGKTGVDWYKLNKRVDDGWCHYGYWNWFKLLHDKELSRIKIIAFEYSLEDDENILFQGTIKTNEDFENLLNQLGIC